MGWWSDAILGGDSPSDYVDEICAEYLDLDPAEVSLSDLSLEQRASLAPSLNEAFWTDMANYATKLEADGFPDDACIYAQVVAVLAMELGAEIPADFKKIAILGGARDNWAKSSDSRRGQILAYLDALSKYESGHPVTLPGNATWRRVEDLPKANLWRVTRIWVVEAETAQAAIERAVHGQHRDVIAGPYMEGKDDLI